MRLFSDLQDIDLSFFLEPDQIDEVFRLKKGFWILDMVIAPNIESIRAILGEDTDPVYLSFVCEFVVKNYEYTRRLKFH